MFQPKQKWNFDGLKSESINKSTKKKGDKTSHSSNVNSRVKIANLRTVNHASQIQHKYLKYVNTEDLCSVKELAQPWRDRLLEDVQVSSCDDCCHVAPLVHR